MIKKLLSILSFVFLTVTSSHAQETVRVVANIATNSDTFLIFKDIFSHLNKSQSDVNFVFQSVPGGNGLISYRRFLNESDTILINQQSLFYENDIDMSRYHLYSFFRNKHQLFVNKDSDINSIDDLLILHQKRKIYHGRVLSGTTSDISLNMLMNDYGFNKESIVNIRSFNRTEELLHSLINKEIDFIIRSKSIALNNENVISILSLDFGPIWLMTLKNDMKNRDTVLNHIINMCNSTFIDNNKFFSLTFLTKMCSDNNEVKTVIEQEINRIHTLSRVGIR
jgi:tripartite-type tricarboxylate transporter receptor subunit TctC